MGRVGLKKKKETKEKDLLKRNGKSQQTILFHSMINVTSSISTNHKKSKQTLLVFEEKTDMFHLKCQYVSKYQKKKIQILHSKQ